MKNTKCPICDFESVRAQGLHQHIYKQSKNDEFHKEILNDQIKIIEKNYLDLNKLESEKEYLFDLNFAKIYLRKTLLNIFECPVCKQKFKDEFSLTLHIKSFINNFNNVTHKTFIDDESFKVKELIQQGYKYKKLYCQSILPNRYIDSISHSMGLIKCEACEKTFMDNSAYGNHLKIHPEIVKKYKDLAISLFDTDLSALEISKLTPFRQGWIGEFYKEKFGKEKLKERVSRISILSLQKQYDEGREGWNKGLTAYTDERIAKSRIRMSATRRKNNKEKGIVNGKEMMNEFEKYEFKKNKLHIKTIHNHHCLACKKDFKNLKKQLACHHIIPFRLSRNNFLSNLTPLCHTCHNKLEKNLNTIETKKMSFNEKCDLYIKGYEDFIK